MIVVLQKQMVIIVIDTIQNNKINHDHEMLPYIVKTTFIASLMVPNAK